MTMFPSSRLISTTFPLWRTCPLGSVYFRLMLLRLQAYPRSTAALKGADASGDHKYFNLTEHNATTLVISLARSLERLVDRDVPRNLLKFRILCAGKHEKLEEVGCLIYANPDLGILNFIGSLKIVKNKILISNNSKCIMLIASISNIKLKYF